MPNTIDTSVEADYSAIAAGQLLTYVNVTGQFARSNGSSWGDGKLGGASGHYVAGGYSAYQNGGYQSVYGHETGGDYGSFWSPFGFSNSGDGYDVTVADSVSPLAGPVALPAYQGPQLVLESPFASLSYHGSSSSGFTSLDGTTGRSSGQTDLSAWHSETNLGVRFGDGSVATLTMLNEAEGLNLSTSSSSMSSGPGGFTFNDMSANATIYESSSSGPIQDAGLAGAFNKVLNLLDQSSANPLGAVGSVLHGTGGMFSGGAGSVSDVALQHLVGPMKG